MSIILKGIDLPKEGEDLTLEINADGYVRAYSTELKEIECEPKAIQIPTPHGRIVDLDEWIMNYDRADRPILLEAEE